jgi:hypothetical protein
VKADDEVKALIAKVHSGELDQFAPHLDGTDFGIYMPTYSDQDGVKLMLQGYSQLERNLKVHVSKGDAEELLDAKPVGWMGGGNAKDSKCTHGGTTKCKHCTGHADHCRHCTHARGKTKGDLVAPKLDYDEAVKQLVHKRDLLDELSKKNFGLTLLHGHNDEHMFTKLPEGYVSVVSDGTTSFRKEEEVLADPTFVPNVWRSVNGKLRVAGGHSELASGEA